MSLYFITPQLKNLIYAQGYAPAKFIILFTNVRGLDFACGLEAC
jgi:hypothetical protein